jgi:hypothetical protein
MSINRVIVSGRLGKDVDLRQTPSGKEVATFSLAVTDSYNRDITLGTYRTEERALMVLDDIQNEIVRQGLMHIEKEYRPSLPDIVFQMPMR